MRKRIIIWIKTNMKFFFRIIFSSAFVFSAALPAMERYGRNASNSQKERVKCAKQYAERLLLEKASLEKVIPQTPSRQIEEEPCPICLEGWDGHKSITLSCHETHTFHVHCMQDWKKRSSLCPLRCNYSFDQYYSDLRKQELHEQSSKKLFYKIAAYTAGAIALRALEIGVANNIVDLRTVLECFAVTGYFP